MKNVSNDLREKKGDIPWRRLTGMRDLFGQGLERLELERPARLIPFGGMDGGLGHAHSIGQLALRHPQ